jgi:hypothetical protein
MEGIFAKIGVFYACFVRKTCGVRGGRWVRMFGWKAESFRVNGLRNAKSLVGIANRPAALRTAGKE